MKKGILLILVLGLPFIAAKSQDSDKSKVTVGFSMGLDHNGNAYRMTEDIEGFTYYGINPSLSFGAYFGYNFTDRFRPRFEIEYFYLKYGMNWNYGEESDFDKTITTVHYLGLNLYFDYAFYLGKRLQLFISPAIITDLARDHQVKNILRDGDDNDHYYNVLSDQYNAAVMGGSLSLPIRYRFNEHISMTLEPGYTYYFQKFIKSNDEPYTRSSIKIGMEYIF